MTPYPTSAAGLPISPYELGIVTEVPEGMKVEYTNHHGCYTAREFGRSIILQTLRDLEALQWIVPQASHNGRGGLHEIYESPILPTPEQALDALVWAYDANMPLRTGSACRPIFTPFSQSRLARIMVEYERLK